MATTHKEVMEVEVEVATTRKEAVEAQIVATERRNGDLGRICKFANGIDNTLDIFI